MNFEKAGGEITISAAHEDGKGDYGAEVAALAQAGGDILIVAGYLDQGGKGIIQSSLDTGAFDVFYLPDGMIGDSLPEAIGPDLNGSIGDVPGTDSPGAAKFAEMATANGFAAGPFAPESYDAAALIILAMQSANSTDSQTFKSHMMKGQTHREKIFPASWQRASNICVRDCQLTMLAPLLLSLLAVASLLVTMPKSKLLTAKTLQLAIARSD